MRWLTICAVLTGGYCGACSQVTDGLGVTTGSIAGAPTSASPGTAATTTGTTNDSRTSGAQRVSGNLFRMLPDDRKFADRIEKDNYTLLRAAQAARANGGTHFVLVEGGEQPATNQLLNAIIGDATTPGAGGYIRVITIEPTAVPPIGAMSADEIISFFGPRFGRSPT